jgi:DNA polymerase III delta prime subunit
MMADTLGQVQAQQSPQSKVKPVFVVGPPSSGKSHYIKQLADRERRTLLHCPCRKDRTLREQRAIIHEWALRAEPTLLWIEGTDDLTPEAQSFLRRILETYAPSVRFCLESQTLESIQEPILSRCEIVRMELPSASQLRTIYARKMSDQLLTDVFENSPKTRRQLDAAITIATVFPSIWAHIKQINNANKELSINSPLMHLYSAAINPWALIYKEFSHLNNDAKREIIATIVNNGNPWALIGYIQILSRSNGRGNN